MSLQPRETVLIKDASSRRLYGHKTHDVRCTWVTRGNVGRYIEVAVSEVPPEMGRCRRCGGGPR